MIIMKTSRKMGRDLFTGLRSPELLLDNPYPFFHQLGFFFSEPYAFLPNFLGNIYREYCDHGQAKMSTFKDVFQYSTLIY